MREINRGATSGELLNAAEDAAWRQSHGLPPRPPRRKRKKTTLPRFALPRQGCRRPCDHQRRVPAVHDVRESGGASDSVHLHTFGTSVATQSQVPTVHTLQVLFLEVVDMPVVVQRQVQGSMVQKSVVVPQMQFIEGRRHPFRAAEAVPHGPVCSVYHRDFAVAVRCLVDDDPAVRVVQDSQVQSLEETVVLPQFQLADVVPRGPHALHARLVLLVLLLALCSLLLSSDPDARHHGWYEPEGLLHGLCLDRIAVDDAFVLCSLSLSAGPCCQASWYGPEGQLFILSGAFSLQKCSLRPRWRRRRESDSQVFCHQFDARMRVYG